MLHIANGDSTAGTLRASAVGGEVIASGATSFGPLFGRFNAIAPEYGYGDYQLWRDLQPLATCRNPLLAISGIGNGGHPLGTGSFARAAFQLTDMGRAVIEGIQDSANLNGIDRWLGGVQVGARVWRWDGERGRIVE